MSIWNHLTIQDHCLDFSTPWAGVLWTISWVGAFSSCLPVGEVKSTQDRKSALHLFRLGDAMLRIVRSKARPLLHVMRCWSLVAPHLVEVSVEGGKNLCISSGKAWYRATFSSPGFLLVFSSLLSCAGRLPQGAPCVSEGCFLHPRHPDGGSHRLEWAASLSFQRSALPALWAHHAAGAVWWRRSRPGQCDTGYRLLFSSAGVGGGRSRHCALVCVLSFQAGDKARLNNLAPSNWWDRNTDLENLAALIESL